MTAAVQRLVLATVAAAVLGIAAAFAWFPLHAAIGGSAGVAYWTILALAASALPVVLPRGTVVSVAAAPILGAAILGGPLAGAFVGALGTIDAREVQRRIPWYGTLFNHALLAISGTAAGIAFAVSADLMAGPEFSLFSVYSFVAAVIAGATFLAVNWSLALLAVSVRTGLPIRTIWAQDLGGVAVSLVGLVPLAWLMATTFQLPNNIGWWATPLFVVPLFTTRLAYTRYVETRELFEQTIEALSKAVDARDPYTRNHSSRVSHIAEAMCREMRLPENEIERIKWAGLLHDIGKIGIRDNVLLKEGPLDKHERVLMNQHPTIGAEIVKPARQLATEAPLIRAHHEWINGSGYPDGAEALNIPLGARVLTIADAYEAMTSSRPYRKVPLSHEQAVDQLERFAGIQFDPEIVPVLIGLDRSILDRPPDRPDELPTMLHQTLRDVPPSPEPRPALASDDVS